MSEKVKELLEESIISEFENLKNLKSGSKEKEQAMNDIANLYKLYNDETKIENDYLIRAAEQIINKKQFEEQISEQSKDRHIKVGMDAVGITLPLVFYAIWMKKGFKFEETGAYTSTTFKGLFNKFKPTK